MNIFVTLIQPARLTYEALFSMGYGQFKYDTRAINNKKIMHTTTIGKNMEFICLLFTDVLFLYIRCPLLSFCNFNLKKYVKLGRSF